MSSRAAVVALISALLALGACSSDEEVQTSAPSSAGTGSATGSPSASADPASPSGSESGDAATPSETTSGSPSVEPATGKRWTFPSYSFVLPRGFTTPGQTSLVTLFQNQQAGTIVAAGQAPTVTPKTLDDAAAEALELEPTGTRQADRVIDGETVYVITIPPDGGLQGNGYQIGRALDDRTVDITFNSIPGFTDEQSAEQLRESVLATVRWKK